MENLKEGVTGLLLLHLIACIRYLDLAGSIGLCHNIVQHQLLSTPASVELTGGCKDLMMLLTEWCHLSSDARQACAVMDACTMWLNVWVRSNCRVQCELPQSHTRSLLLARSCPTSSSPVLSEQVYIIAALL